MKSVSSDFLLSLTCFLWKLSIRDWQKCDGCAHRHGQGYTSTSGLQLHGQHLRDRSELYKQAMRLSPKRFLPKQHDLSTLVQTLPVFPSKDEFILVVSSWEDRLHQSSPTPAASGHSLALCMNGGVWQWHIIQGGDWDSTAEGVMGIWKTG